MSIEVRIRKAFKNFCLDVEFANEEGCLGILGASGSGKSMTLKCIAGIETPDSGKITVNGRVLFDSAAQINLTPKERRVGYLFQNYALFPTMTVEENINICLRGSKNKCREVVRGQIERFRLQGLEKRYPAQLSGGQQQRVALARIFAYNPEIILLDEPFSALDSFLKEQLFWQMLETIKGYDGDTMLVSHSRDEIYQFCRKLMIMENGGLTQMGAAKEVFAAPRTLEAARLIGYKNISIIEKLGNQQLYARDWGLKLWTKERITDKIRYIAIHDHVLRKAEEGDEDNIYEAIVAGIRQEPLATSYFLKPKNQEGGIWWKQEHSGYQAGELIKVVLDKERLMLLS